MQPFAIRFARLPSWKKRQWYYAGSRSREATLMQLRRTHTCKVPCRDGCSHLQRTQTEGYRATAFSPSHYNAFWSVTCQTCMYLRTWQHKMTTIMQPLKIRIYKHSIQETTRNYAHMNNHSVAEHQGAKSTSQWKDRSRNRRTHKVPFIAACSHFTRKNDSGFALRLPPQDKPHANSRMQPLQCVDAAIHVANLHVPASHMATQDDNNHAAIPMRSATTDSKKQIELHEQPHVAEHQWGTDKTRKRSQPQPPHTQGTFHRRLQPLYSKKRKASCSGFLPNRSPMQHSCGHYNAFCSITRQTCMYLRTWQHKMTTIMRPFQCDRQPQIPRSK